MNVDEDEKAEGYWSRRIMEADSLVGVLSFSLPEYLNRAYVLDIADTAFADQWVLRAQRMDAEL